MNDGPCAVDGCAKPARTREMCTMHYERWRTKGSPGKPETVRVTVSGTCEVEGCSRSKFTRLYCTMHNSRFRKNGDPGGPLRVADDPQRIAARFWRHVTPTGFCWLWDRPQRNGYGMFLAQRRYVPAHRFAYELLVGPMPGGLELDHLCRNKRCVNPDHLEPVTHRENSHRAHLLRGAMASRTHCRNGHEFSPENTYISARGSRTCRECHRQRERARQRRKVAT